MLRRIYEHKHKLQKGFTKKYNVDQLVYYEVYDDIGYALAREKQLKGWTRNKLVNEFNHSWKDLYEELC